MLQAVQNCFFFFFFWFTENVEKPWLGEQPTTTVKKYGRMVVEQQTSSFPVLAPEGPAGAEVCSRPFSPRVPRLVNGQNKYLVVFIGIVGRWGGWTWACNSEMQIQFPSRATGSLCNLRWVVYSLDGQMQIIVALWEVSLLLCLCPAGDLGPDTSRPSK